MIKVENIEVFGWEAAIRGMRNPMNSWEKSDSTFLQIKHDNDKWGSVLPMLGKNDLDLMQRLYKGGTEHRKYLRMIHVQMDITAPLYWFKEWDTYKIATTSNSTSTMHKIHAKEFTIEDFSHEHLLPHPSMKVMESVINALNVARTCYLECEDNITKKDWWWQMIQLLPSSYNQRRTVDFSYETAVNIIMQRCNHKLDEWREFVDVLLGLPYMNKIMRG